MGSRIQPAEDSPKELVSREFCQVLVDFLNIEMKNNKNKGRKRFNFGKYHLIKPKDPLVNNDCCPICLDEFKVGTYKRGLKCGHVYHKKCIDKWFKRMEQEQHEKKCPVCRKIYA